MEHSVLSLLCRLLLVIIGTTACSRVGSNIQAFPDGSNFRQRESLFLNLGAPSQCSGNITAWHLYYELDDCNNDRSQTRTQFMGVLKFIVYRPIEVNNRMMSYETVPERIKSVTISCDKDDEDRSQSSRGKNQTVSLQTHEQFMIQRNDVIAVCLPNVRGKQRRGKQRIQILDRQNERNDIYEYIYTRRSRGRDCDFSRLQTLSTNSRDLKARNGYQLHLYAEIKGLELSTTTPPIPTMDTSTTNSQPLNDSTEALNIVLSDTQKINLYLKTVPTSVGGLLVLVAVVVLIAGIVVCWSKKRKQRTSSAPNDNEGHDSTDQRYCSSQQRTLSARVTTIDIKDNIAYHAYDFPEQVYAQPHVYSSIQDDYELNDYETVTPY